MLQDKGGFLGHRLQKGLNLFSFLLAFPAVDILGNSLYFYIFIWILIKTKKITGKNFIKSRFGLNLLFLGIFGLFSTIFHPISDELAPSFVEIAVTLLRNFYWFAIGAYFFSWKRKINIYKLAKWITMGYFLQALFFYFPSFKLNTFVITINTEFERNAFIFNSIIFSGFVFLYFYKKFGQKSFYLVGLIIMANLFFTNGRAGAAIAIILFLFNYALINTGVRTLGKASIFLVILLNLFNYNLNNAVNSLGDRIAPLVEGANPRFAELLRGEGQGDLTFDKSWLHRELMLDKTMEIIRYHTFLGVGFGNFSKYNAQIESLDTEKYSRLRHRTRERYNRRSAHNSYANHLAETGLIGFLLLLLLILPIVFRFIKIFWLGTFSNYGLEIVIVIGLFGALIHGYSISAFSGANIWFVLGICRNIINK